MRYSFEFKMKCVELYRQGIWAETPEKVMKSSFRKKIVEWDKIEKIHGPKGLERVKKQRKWSQEEKLTFVLQVLNGKTLTEVSFPAGINHGLLSSWVHKYLTYGYNGLKNKYLTYGYNGLKNEKSGQALSKEPVMNKKLVSDTLSESEREELIRLRERNAYLEAEIAVIKKLRALRKEQEAALLKARKQRSSRNCEK